jgi:methylated-DNA-protein-cysteine methyltransferase related protein
MTSPVNRYQVIWSTVSRIPRGKVATYGQVATLSGLDGHARQVGYALHNLPERSDVPWHRVVNSRGEVSPRTSGDSHELQRMLLEGEGVEFDLRGRLELRKYRWQPPTARAKHTASAKSSSSPRRAR